jgi:thymidylate kinase
MVCVASSDTGRLNFVHPDICGDYFRGGRLFLRVDEILRQRTTVRVNSKKFNNISVPSPCHGFIYYLLKKIDKGQLDTRHSDYLSAEWAKDPAGCSKELRRFWAVSDVELISQAAIDNNWDVVRAELCSLQKMLDANLQRLVKHRWFEVLRIAQRIFRPTGLTVAFLGSDGVGKSTILAKVGEELAPAFRRTRHYHLRPFFGRSPVSKICNSNPQGQAPRGILSSLAKLLLWWADYTAGYLLEIFPRKVRSTLILFDRYYHDILIDPRRYRYGGPAWLATIIAWLIPQPDIFILLDAPPEIVRLRKQEVPLGETSRQRIAYLELTGKLNSAYVVNAARPVDLVLSDVEKIILSYMADRTSRRMRES